MRLFNKVAIIGVGLIGGSIGLGLKKRQLATEVVGVGRHKRSLWIAKKRLAIDEGYLEAKRAVVDADLIILATPISKIISLSEEISPYIKEGAIVTDVGSTKGLIVKRLQKIFSQKKFFVGAHPLAGSEKKGIIQARPGLFKNAICIVAKTNRTNPQALTKIGQLWKALGAKVVIMTPERHDWILAKVSHLPHLVAKALVLSLKEKELAFGAGGLTDTTRIASSDPFIWQDIFLTNQQKVLAACREFKRQLDRLTRAIEGRDEQALFSLLKKAKLRRDRLAKNSL